MVPGYGAACWGCLRISGVGGRAEAEVVQVPPASVVPGTLCNYACPQVPLQISGLRICLSLIPKWFWCEPLGQRLKSESWAPFCSPTSHPLFPFCLFQVDKAASGLLSIGLRKGDRLGMWGPNSYAWVLMQLATAQAGIILVRRGLPGIAGYAGGRASFRGAPWTLGPRITPVPGWFQTS